MSGVSALRYSSHADVELPQRSAKLSVSFSGSHHPPAIPRITIRIIGLRLSASGIELPMSCSVTMTRRQLVASSILELCSPPIRALILFLAFVPVFQLRRSSQNLDSVRSNLSSEKSMWQYSLALP